MILGNLKVKSWNFLSLSILVFFSVMQAVRWRILPQSQDIYYHLLTAWGFIQAGGYSGWDFWECAPFGRTHIYPPFFHFLLAFLMKAGANKIILAKTFEVFLPTVFLFTLWNFVRRNFNQRMAFFALLAVNSSFSFYMGLVNYPASTLALIFGILGFDHLLRKIKLRAALLFVLTFYTHIGISFFCFLGVCVYCLFLKEKKNVVIILFGIVLLSIPMLWKEFTGLVHLKRTGLALAERYYSQIKVLEYFLALWGVILAVKLGKKHLFFLALFISSLIFIFYPFRFFSAEGYLPVILLSSLGWYNLYSLVIRKYSRIKYLAVSMIILITVLSPTISLQGHKTADKLYYKLNPADSALLGMLFPAAYERNFALSAWFGREYASGTAIIQGNSVEGDIIYSSINLAGVCLASLSQRSTANGLFGEVKFAHSYDPLAVSRIIILAKDDPKLLVGSVVNGYGLIGIGENKLFSFYKNPHTSIKMSPRNAVLPFWVITILFLVFSAVFWKAPVLERVIFHREDEG